MNLYIMPYQGKYVKIGKYQIGDVCLDGRIGKAEPGRNMLFGLYYEVTFPQIIRHYPSGPRAFMNNVHRDFIEREATEEEFIIDCLEYRLEN